MITLSSLAFFFLYIIIWHYDMKQETTLEYLCRNLVDVVHNAILYVICLLLHEDWPL